jgi:hypothetical protein
MSKGLFVIAGSVIVVVVVVVFLGFVVSALSCAASLTVIGIAALLTFASVLWICLLASFFY